MFADMKLPVTNRRMTGMGWSCRQCMPAYCSLVGILRWGGGDGVGRSAITREGQIMREWSVLAQCGMGPARVDVANGIADALSRPKPPTSRSRIEEK